MFKNKFRGILSAPAGKMKDKKGRSTRMVDFVMKLDFTEAIAAGLHRDAQVAMRGLQKHNLNSIEIPFGKVSANIKITSGSKELKIMGAHGVKIVGKARDKDEESPICDIHWRITYDRASWAFLGEHYGSTVEIRLTNQQEVFEYESEAASDHPKDDKKKPRPRPTKGQKKTKKAAKTKPTKVATVTPINAGKNPA